jgi:hypothetical protein
MSFFICKKPNPFKFLFAQDWSNSTLSHMLKSYNLKTKSSMQEFAFGAMSLKIFPPR